MTPEGRERGPLDFDLDEELPPQPPPSVAATAPPPVGGAAPRYVWVIGVAALVLVAVLVATTLRHGTERGARGVPAGDVMPPFAVPLALSDLDGDANLAEHLGDGDGAAGARPACAVRGPRVLNGCALRAAGPLVLAFFTTHGKECVAQLDVLQRVARELPGVAFAAVAIRGDRDAVRALVRSRGWSFPVGYDRDGGLANAYHVQVCPQLTFARRGGRVAETTFGALDAGTLRAKARRLTGP